MAFAAPRGKFCAPSVTPVFIASLSLNEPNEPTESTGPNGPNEPISYWALPLGKFKRRVFKDVDLFVVAHVSKRYVVEDDRLELKVPAQNPAMKYVYDELMKGRAHELLHIHYPLHGHHE